MRTGDTYTGKIVEVHRYQALAEMAQSDPEVKAWFGMAFKGIGPYFKERTTATGLSFEEQKLLLPEIFGIEPTDKDFRKVVNQKYDEFITKIPQEGIKLQVSLMDDTKPLSADNMPYNVMDYIKLKHIIGHPEVAKDRNEAEKLFGKRFYLVDPDQATSQAVNVNNLEDKAMVIYMKHKDDKIKTDQILTMLGVGIRGMKHEDKVLKLKSFSSKNSKMNESEQKEAFEQFIKIAEDKNLEFKYLIEEMIGAQYLSKVGTNILLKESGEKIGDNLEDAVLYYKNPKNSRELNLLKAQYLQKVKHGSEAYLPKEAQTKD